MNAPVRIGAAFLALAAGVLLTPGTRAADEADTPDEADKIRDVFLLLDDGPLHLRLRITVGGKSPEQVRREYLARLFKTLDTDEDGKLTYAEYIRSPLNTSRRGGGRPLSPREANRVMPADRLTQALERVAGGTLAFRQDNSARETDDLVFQALDANNNGTLTETEIVETSEFLLAKDQDDDDCITIDEFGTQPDQAMALVGVPGVTPERPLATVSNILVDGSGLLTAPRLVRRYDRNRDAKLSREECGFSMERFKAVDADGDGKLTVTELRELHKQPADVEASLELETAEGKTPRVRLKYAPNTRADRPDFASFIFSGTEVALAVRPFDPFGSAIEDAKQQFNGFDGDQNGYLEKEELADNVRFQRGLFEVIDTDADGKMFWPEMEAYVRSRAEVAATRCDIVLHDLGHGFFETLDRNSDGRLGVREIRGAADTLRKLRKSAKAGLKPTDPPRRLHLEVVRGSFQLFGTGRQGESTVPEIVIRPRVAIGPDWFQRMDRNIDGDLTWDEFLGPRHVFDELDTDDDELIDPTEAEKAG